MTVTKDGGVVKADRTTLLGQRIAVYKTIGAYYSHRHFGTLGVLTPDQRLTGFVTMVRQRIRFLVPPNQWCSGQGVAYTPHLQTIWSRAQDDPLLSGLGPQLYERVTISDMTLDTIGASGWLRGGVDFFAGLMNSYLASCNELCGMAVLHSRSRP